MPVLAVVVIGALAAGVTVWLGKRPKPEGGAARDSGPTGGVSVERAKHASSLLSEDAHRAVYGRIATNRAMEAITEYRRHTGRSLRDAMVDVQSLAAYPQVYTLPQDPEPTVAQTPERGAADAGTAHAPADQSAAPAGDTPPVDADLDGRAAAEEPQTGPQAHVAAEHPADTRRAESAEATPPDGEADRDGDRPSSSTDGADGAEGEPTDADVVPDLMVPADWSAEPAPEDRPFEVEVMRGDGAVHLSSRDLPPWLRDQLSAMMRDGNLETAAVQLSTHTELSVPEAFELLRRIQESRGQ